MIPSLVQQITAACMPRPTERQSPRKLRQENILIMLLMTGTNMRARDISQRQKKSLRTVVNDLRELVDAGHVCSYSPSGVEHRGRMYSLTKPGIERAKQLKEMSE